MGFFIFLFNFFLRIFNVFSLPSFRFFFFSFFSFLRCPPNIPDVIRVLRCILRGTVQFRTNILLFYVKVQLRWIDNQLILFPCSSRHLTHAASSCISCRKYILRFLKHLTSTTFYKSLQWFQEQSRTNPNLPVATICSIWLVEGTFYNLPTVNRKRLLVYNGSILTLNTMRRFCKPLIELSK